MVMTWRNYLCFWVQTLLIISWKPLLYLCISHLKNFLLYFSQYPPFMIHMHDSNIPQKLLPKVISEVKILLLFRGFLMLTWESHYLIVKKVNKIFHGRKSPELQKIFTYWECSLGQTVLQPWNWFVLCFLQCPILQVSLSGTSILCYLIATKKGAGSILLSLNAYKYLKVMLVEKQFLYMYPNMLIWCWDKDVLW